MREAWNVTALDVLRVQIRIFSSVGSKTKKSNMHLQFKPMIYSNAPSHARIFEPRIRIFGAVNKKLLFFTCSPASFTLILIFNMDLIRRDLVSGGIWVGTVRVVEHIRVRVRGRVVVPILH